VYAPVAGTVVAVNEQLRGSPELVNSDPYGSGWMLRLKAAAGASPELLSADAYAAVASSG
jgi:glycine cleavage system H protein